MKGFIIFASILAVASMGFLAGPFSPTLSGPENFLNCNVIVEAGPGAQLCEPGIEAPLTATVTGDYLSVAWTPADAVADPTSLNTTAVVEQTTTFTITARAVSDENLIVNGDFSLNDTTTFSSDYIYGTGGGVGLLSNEGQYAIAANAGSTHNHFANCSDHTGGGNMMVVNASGELNNVWCQTVQITPNTDYSFSAWVTSVVSQNPAQLQFSINGGLLGNVFQASPITCNWNQFAEFWNSGSATTAEICIVNVNLTPAGNDFALDDIVFSPVCEITDELTVTVIDLNPSWVSPGDLCSDAPAIALDNLLTVESTPGGQWSIDGVPASTFDPSALSPGPHTVRYVLTLEDCIFEDIQTISVFTAPNSGQTLDAYMICSGESATVNLADLLAGEDTGGIWTEVSAVPSTGGAFNGGAGTFATTGQNAGIYDFEYRIAGQGPCADATTTVSVMLHETPVADAGEDKAVDCDVSEATLGGPATSIGDNLSYEWIALNGSPIGQPNTRFITVDQPDTYVFTVINNDNGCRSTDEVVLTSNIAEISAEAVVSQVSCGGTNDGSIAVGPVSGGQDPYTFSINGGPFITQPPIKPGETFTYEFTIQDGNAGAHMYHSHHNAAFQVTSGLLGAFIVEPKDPSTRPAFDSEYTMILNDGPIGAYSINGKTFPSTEPVVAKKGETVLIRYMNEGLMIHPMHLHGFPMTVVANDGYALPQPYMLDTVNVAPGQRIDAIVEPDLPGVWAFHCHVLSHAESKHGMFGMVTALIVEE